MGYRYIDPWEIIKLSQQTTKVTRPQTNHQSSIPMYNGHPRGRKNPVKAEGRLCTQQGAISSLTIHHWLGTISAALKPVKGVCRGGWRLNGHNFIYKRQKLLERGEFHFRYTPRSIWSVQLKYTLYPIFHLNASLKSVLVTDSSNFLAQIPIQP